MNIFLSHEKSFMLMNEGIVLGHCVSVAGIKVDHAKTLVIQDLPTHKKQWDV
jgi:hypothetical protein